MYLMHRSKQQRQQWTHQYDQREQQQQHATYAFLVMYLMHRSKQQRQQWMILNMHFMHLFFSCQDLVC
jgi:hypothetical protein